MGSRAHKNPELPQLISIVFFPRAPDSLIVMVASTLGERQFPQFSRILDMPYILGGSPQVGPFRGTSTLHPREGEQPEGGVASKAPPQPPRSREDAPAHLPQPLRLRAPSGACAVPRLRSRAARRCRVAQRCSEGCSGGKLRLARAEAATPLPRLANGRGRGHVRHARHAGTGGVVRAGVRARAVSAAPEGRETRRNSRSMMGHPAPSFDLY